MHFHKYPHPSNFEFVSRHQPGCSFRTRKGTYRLSLRACAGEVYHFRITGKGWGTNDSQAGLRPRAGRGPENGGKTRLFFDPEGGLRLEDRSGALLLASKPGRFFGKCAEASIFEFIRNEGDQFYGMGEKWTGFEHSGRTTKFWNTDVWADFKPESYIEGRPAPDPVYVSVPYLILKRGNTYLGFLLDNPHCTFISTGFKIDKTNPMEMTPGAAGDGGRFFHLGAERGQPNLYILVGPSLAELTRKLQKLIGTTPRPPAWALGYHQCRWGYESEADLVDLDIRFRKHGIPVDGLCLDIDYMDGHRVFSFNEAHFPAPARSMAKLAASGRKVVPILDPGIKLEPNYGVYERGRAAKALCRNPQGGEYTGLVWPGETVFPDFSLPTVRRWWAGEVAEFARHGIHGAWLDMNDPASGPVENHDMLFNHGRKAHSSYHNQYATGMGIATHQGFLEAHPNKRPFLLSRSGFIGSNRYTAIWTGDNYSNYHHLKNSIPTTLNLALSGIPFNGPDVGGFGGDTTPDLIREWFKACFLFPVMRNHSMLNTRRQEPWAFDLETLEVLRRFIRLRYRFRPYLYQLFVEHERTGEAILRPLFYDFEDTAALPLGKVDDQFMVGRCVMQAPFVEKGRRPRRILLPGNEPWHDLSRGQWIKGGRNIRASRQTMETPIFVRDRSIVPLARLKPSAHAFYGDRVDFHVFLSADGEAGTRYVFDDGATFDYRKGKVSEVEITAKRTGGALAITTKRIKDGCGPGSFTFSVPSEISHLTINGRTAGACPSQGIAVAPGIKTFGEPSSGK